MSSLSISTNFQIIHQDVGSPNFGKLLLRGLKLPDNSAGFSILTKIWNSCYDHVAKNRYEVASVFREKKVEDGYECTFSLKSTPTRISENKDPKDFLSEQVLQFGNILKIFLSSSDFVKYCDYLANNQPNIAVCNLMLDDFLEETGIKTN